MSYFVKIEIEIEIENYKDKQIETNAFDYFI